MASELDKAIAIKQQNKEIEGMHRDYERNFMLKAQEAKHA